MSQGAMLWGELSDDTGEFDFDLVYRGKNALPDAPADVGPVLSPKLFRRVAEWSVNKRAKMTTQTFKNFLRHQEQRLLLRRGAVLGAGREPHPSPCIWRT